jgi:hypothetical protein
VKPKVRVRVQFGPPPRVERAPEPPRVTRVSRLLALAWWLDRQIRAGEIEDLAEAASGLRLTRARVTQVMNLTLLAPEIQAAILGGAPAAERCVRAAAAEPSWARQLNLWNERTKEVA